MDSKHGKKNTIFKFLSIISVLLTTGCLFTLYNMEANFIFNNKESITADMQKYGFLTDFVSVVPKLLSSTANSMAVAAIGVIFVIFWLPRQLEKLSRTKPSKFSWSHGFSTIVIHFTFLLVIGIIRNILILMCTPVESIESGSTFLLASVNELIINSLFPSLIFYFVPEYYSKYMICLPLYLTFYTLILILYDKYDITAVMISKIFEELSFDKTISNPASYAAAGNLINIFKIYESVYGLYIYIAKTFDQRAHFTRGFFSKYIFLSEFELVVGLGGLLFTLFHEGGHGASNRIIGLGFSSIFTRNSCNFFGVFFYLFFYKRSVKVINSLRENENFVEREEKRKEIQYNLQNYFYGILIGFFPVSLLTMAFFTAVRREEFLVDLAFIELDFHLPLLYLGFLEIFKIFGGLNSMPLKYIYFFDTHPPHYSRAVKVFEKIKEHLSKQNP